MCIQIVSNHTMNRPLNPMLLIMMIIQAHSHVVCFTRSLKVSTNRFCAYYTKCITYQLYSSLLLSIFQWGFLIPCTTEKRWLSLSLWPSLFVVKRGRHSHNHIVLFAFMSVCVGYFLSFFGWLFNRSVVHIAHVCVYYNRVSAFIDFGRFVRCPTSPLPCN